MEAVEKGVAIVSGCFVVWTVFGKISAIFDYWLESYWVIRWVTRYSTFLATSSQIFVAFAVEYLLQVQNYPRAWAVRLWSTR